MLLEPWKNPDEHIGENENHLYFHHLEINTPNMSEASPPSSGGYFIIFKVGNTYSEMHRSEAYDSVNFDKCPHHVYSPPVKIWNISIIPKKSLRSLPVNPQSPTPRQSSFCF